LKLHAQAPTHFNTVTGYGPDYIEVNRVRHAGSLIVAPDSPVHAWRAETIDTLQEDDFAPVLALEPELVLVGTGARQTFLPAHLLARFAQSGVGFEIMDTAAACRTFNILMAENRRVVGAFLSPNASAKAPA
jgi:uncharacterized protein